MSADGAMIEKLFEMGQGAAKRWLRRHFEALGQQSTVNIRRDYVGAFRRSFSGPASPPLFVLVHSPPRALCNVSF
jgi:hypothetical protein